MDLALKFLILAALSGFVADKKLEENPNLGIPATVISLISTVTAVMILLLNWNNL